MLAPEELAGIETSMGETDNIHDYKCALAVMSLGAIDRLPKN